MNKPVQSAGETQHRIVKALQENFGAQILNSSIESNEENKERLIFAVRMTIGNLELPFFLDVDYRQDPEESINEGIKRVRRKLLNR